MNKSAKPLTVSQRIEVLMKQSGVSEYDARHLVMREVIAEINEKEQQQIAAGTHINCPVCDEFVKVENGKVAMHDDSRAFMNFQSNDLPDCKAVGRPVRRKAVR